MANKWLNTLNMQYDLDVGSIHIYDNSIQEITAEQYTALSANAIFSDMVTKGNIVVFNSQPSESNSECFIRPLSGDITLNGMPVNNDGVPSITLGEALKEIDNIEANKSAEIDVSDYASPIVINPSEGKDAMKKTTVSLSNIPKLSHARCWKKDGKSFYFDFKEAVETDANFKEAYNLKAPELALVDSPLDANINCCAYSPKLNLFIIVSNYAEIYYSSDALHWTEAEATTGHINLECAYWDKYREMFILVGNDSSNKALIRTSVDGIHYTDTPLISFGALNSVCSNSTIVVAVGNGGLIITSTDLTNWTQQTSGVNDDLSSIAYNESLDMFCVTGYYAFRNTLISADAITWTAQEIDSDIIKGSVISFSIYFLIVGYNRDNHHNQLIIGSWNSTEFNWTPNDIPDIQLDDWCYWESKQAFFGWSTYNQKLYKILNVFSSVTIETYFTALSSPTAFCTSNDLPLLCDQDGRLYTTPPINETCTLSKNKYVFNKTYVKNNANSFSLTQEYEEPEVYTRYADGDVQLQ